MKRKYIRIKNRKYPKGKKHQFFGKKHTNSSRNKMKGRIFTEEHKQKLREAKLKNPTNYWLGKKRPELSGDGDYWHGNPFKYPNPSEMQKEQIEEDCIRTRELLDSGYKLIRLWESTINGLDIIGFETLINTKINEDCIINGI